MSDVTLRLTVSELGSSQERIDELSTTLINQLVGFGVDTISKERGTSIKGAKGDPVTIGTVLLGLGTAALPNVIAFIQNWVGESRRVKLEAPNGAKVEFVPNKKLSKAEILELVHELNKIEAKSDME